MKMISCKWVLMVLLSVFVLSCKKDNETSSASYGTGSVTNTNGGGGVTGTTSSATARYTQNCTIETLTALWCYACPAAKTNIDAAVAAYSGKGVFPMEFHPDQSFFAQDDLLGWSGTYILSQTFPFVGGWPTIHLNRGIIYNWSSSEIAPLITTSSTSAVSSTIGLAINSNLNGDKLSVTVKSRFSNAANGYKLVVYVLESGIVATHKMEDGSENANYVNDNVVRVSATSSVLGDAIPSQAAAAEYAKTYTVTVPATWNSSNLSVVAMVVNSANKLINAQRAKVGQAQDFQILVP